MRDELLSKRSGEISAMFGRIAHRYDLLNRVLSLGQDLWWRRVLARRVAGARPRLVLDVCTGTGDVALACARTAPVVGADFCLPMLVHARRKALGTASRVSLVAADALRLPLAEGTVDAVTVAFGIRNFESLESGLGELVRVLRPGGLLLALEFSRPSGALSWALQWWVRVVPPRVGRLISGDGEAYSYLPASVSTFPDADAMCSTLGSLELDPVSSRALTGGVATLYEGVKIGGSDDRRQGA